MPLFEIEYKVSTGQEHYRTVDAPSPEEALRRWKSWNQELGEVVGVEQIDRLLSARAAAQVQKFSLWAIFGRLVRGRRQ